ncbi:non-ribosomal peptide synthetase [Streptomyces caelestis]|uniref:Amino acid adenylation domain-containing protein n=1 Tax=Streptomyces caelestis TaxID=36816 RepID=A0A7W9HAS1_9ACTN|nr:non-ribosomal peptide synthetase [Streptomyces caelestis]MBB5798534.1 amino acid adenylation domain-containing protein [Streptomyces caelestis]GGW51042.1 hypothetical protein GCM10010320_34630 [Streptomyces caelestis]
MSTHLTADQRRLLDRLLDEQTDRPAPAALAAGRADRAHAELSSAQSRIWFFDQVRPGSSLYTITGVARLRGALDTDVLRRALDEVLRRHEVLRTTYHGEDEPWARVEEAGPLEMSVTDLSGLPEESRGRALRERLDAEAARPFDLSRDRMLRSALLRLTPDEYLLQLSMHHIAADGWSLGVLVRELGALYTAFRQGQKSPLPELAVQYADYAAWQRERLAEPRHTELLNTWTERLADVGPLDLVTDRPRQETESFAGAWARLELPADLVERVKEFADAERVTPYMVLTAAFAAVLARWSAGAEDVVLGCAVAGRNRVEIEPLIGFFVNTLLLRLDLGGDPSFRTVVARAKDACTDGYAGQDVPFEQIVEVLRPERDPGARVPLVRHMLVLHNSPRPRLELPGLDVTVLPVETGTAKFELQLELAPTPEGALSGWIEFSRELFDEATVAGMAGAFRLLLADGVERPHTPVRSLRILGDDDEELVQQQWSGVRAGAVGDGCLHRLFERTADERPAAPAVVHDGTVETYAQLERRANRLAHCLLARGVGAEDVVGIALPRSTDAIAAMLGVLKAGAAYLPLDPDHPPHRLAKVAADAAARVVITASDTAAGDLAAAAGDELTAPVALSVHDDAVQRAADTRPDVTVLPGNSAYVLYTSGSTGQPKGAVNEHAAVVNRILWMQRAYRLEPDEAVLHKTPLGFDVSGWEWLWPLAAGARIVVAGADGRRDPALITRLIREHSVTTCHFVPSMLRIFLEEPTAADCADVLRRVVCSGEALPPGSVRRAREVLPGVELYNLYGPTEAAIDVTAWTVPGDAGADGAARLPIGTPIAGARTYVLDEHMRPVPPGAPGELFLGGSPVGRGYLRRPGLTAERFVPDPFTPGQRLYRTGDRARWLHDGSLDFLGRLDAQLKIRGQRIEPGEVEAVLSANPVVEQAAAIPYRDAAGDLQLAAFVSLRDDAVASAADGHAEQPTGEDEGGNGAHVDRWRTVFDETYRGSAPDDPRFDIAGWVDSATGDPLPAHEMRAWVDETVERIAALRPQRVLEIGCGTGLLLFRLAPGCELYCGTDISAEAVESLRTHTQGLEGAKIELSQAAADDFSGRPPGSFDTVVLNSVAQYFPDVDYLVRVVRGALRMLSPGGHLFIGDVRNLLLLEELHTSILLHRLPPDTPVSTLRRLVAQQVAREEELIVHPALFEAVAGAGAVTVVAKSSPYRNELTRFRYDVIISADPPGEPLRPATEGWTAWPGPSALPDDGAAQSFGWLGVPDGRLREDLLAVRLMHAAGAGETIGGLRRAMAAAEHGAAADPAALAERADAAGYRMLPRLRAEPGTLDLEFTAPGHSLSAPRPLPHPVTDPAGWDAFVSDPRRAVRRRLTVSALRDHLGRVLPDYMVPASLMVLPEWPLGRTGKLDRAALPPPDGLRPTLATSYVAPRSETEHLVARVWREVLNLDRIGVHDDFFALGGHSLLAVQLVGRLRARHGDGLSIGTLLRAPTIAAVAALLDRPSAASPAPGPIRRAERRPVIGTNRKESR